MNPNSNIFTKRTLLEAVRLVKEEVNVNDVLNSKWQQDTSAEMDTEFYRERTAEFWEDMEHWLQVLKAAPEAEQKEWAYEAGWDSDVVANIHNFLSHTIDLDWIHTHLSDKKVYSIMQQGGGHVDKVLKKLLTDAIF